MNNIVKYILYDLIRNKSIILYSVLLFGLSLALFLTEDESEKGILSLMQIMLFIVPLMSLIFTCIYLYNSTEFIKLLLSHPLKRSTIWISLYTGIALALGLSFLLAVGIPILIFAQSTVGYILILSGLLLTLIFASFAMCIAIFINDKSRGIGLSIGLWLYFVLIFDTIILFLLFQFADYPIENLMIALSISNPIDVSRIFMILQLDISAMLGYTGAIFNTFFGKKVGLVITLFVMLLWVIIPLYSSLKKFLNKDL